VTSTTLAQSYLLKARHRLRVLEILLEEGAYSDVVREAQELVELALKGVLRQAGVDPPKWHDVGPVLLEHQDLLSAEVRPALTRLAEISRWLRREREFAFYGDVDIIPTEAYGLGDASRAVEDARFVLECATKVIPDA
jgi:HEPN domain-containing protein